MSATARIGPGAAVVGAIVLLFACCAAAQNLVVDSTGDLADAVPGDGVCDDGTGACTLRAAIEEANASPGIDGLEVIAFAIPGAGPHTIAPATPLPAILEPLVIDGYSQPGARMGTSATGVDALPMIEITGRSSTAGDGLRIVGTWSFVGGLVVNGWRSDGEGRYGDGVVVAGTGIGFWGSFVGTDVTGGTAIPNASAGVRVTGDDDLVGGWSPSMRNVVSGNGLAGVVIEGADDAALGNVIGLDASGAVALPNGIGASIQGPRTELGGWFAPPNVIAGNAGVGIVVGGGADGSEVANCLVGTDATATYAIGNDGDGIRVDGAPGIVVGGSNGLGTNVVAGNAGNGISLLDTTDALVTASLIGTNAAATPLGNAGSGIYVTGVRTTIGAWFEPNVIAFNGNDGVGIVGAAALGNVLHNNRIHHNADLGIDLGDDGPTPDDPLDADAGPNRLQNAPVIVTALGDGSTGVVTGYVEGAPGTALTLELFSAECAGDARRPDVVDAIAVADAVVGGVGVAPFTISRPGLSPGDGLTATATDEDGNTSELASCALVHAPAPATTSTSTSTSSSTVTTTTTTTLTTTTATTMPPRCDDDPSPSACGRLRCRLRDAAALLASEECTDPARRPRRLARRLARELGFLAARSTGASCCGRPHRRRLGRILRSLWRHVAHEATAPSCADPLAVTALIRAARSLEAAEPPVLAACEPGGAARPQPSR